MLQYTKHENSSLLKYQHITTQIKQYLTRKGGHTKASSETMGL